MDSTFIRDINGNKKAKQKIIEKIMIYINNSKR